MLFNSLTFLYFLGIVFTVYWWISPKYRMYFLLITSLYFYACFEWWYVLLLLLTTALDFWVVKAMLKREQNKKIYLWTSILANLLVLSSFKYGYFFIHLIRGNEWQYQWAIPVGISFYTFQSMSYVIDVYRGRYRPNDTFTEFLLYVSFFPHMVAGPVVRYHALMPQLKKITFFKDIAWWEAYKLCLWGYFKKMVIADNLDSIVTPAFQNIQHFNAIETLLVGFLFAVQMYTDFSGYSDIAMGIAKLFNINLSINWLRPFLSKSVHELWHKYHISVTSWFRDYLYISLGGNRVNVSRWIMNILVTFAISGFWHGSSYTFIIWGMLHGIMYLLEYFFISKTFLVRGIVGHIYLLTFYSIAVIAFRAVDLQNLLHAYANFFQDWSFTLHHLIALNDKIYWYFAWIVVGIVFMKEIIEESTNVNVRYLADTFREVFYVLLFVGIFLLGNFHSLPFIYFQF